ncbi:TIR-like protein FxsC [Thermocatellispora tengchongensis]|uniref:TIR-like protein FxsC n=1 Tax=Thermocatellispora tengchongensis TaxID=1073253 RepID=UPI00363EF0CD
MSVSPASEPAPQVPYFFLSYAHTPLLSSRRGANINLWVERLFDDLCGHLLAWTALRRDSDAGFMDRDIRSGDRWPDQLAEALATCRVFVPLYSPRYFASVECGKEWSAFQQRLDLHPEGGAPTAIVPALWSPMREPGGLPECAHDIQYDDAAFGPRYRQEGFYGLMKVTSMRSHYQRATLALARRIMEAAERLPPVRPSAPPTTPP